MINPSERIEALLQDVDTILTSYPSNNGDLIQIILEDDIPYLVNYVLKVEKFIQLIDSNQLESATSFLGGYMSAIRDLKREVNEASDN